MINDLDFSALYPGVVLVNDNRAVSCQGRSIQLLRKVLSWSWLDFLVAKAVLFGSLGLSQNARTNAYLSLGIMISFLAATCLNLQPMARPLPSSLWT